MKIQLSNPTLHENVGFISPNATIIGNITLQREVSVWFNCTLRAESAEIFINDETNIQDGCIIHSDPGQPVHIGSRVTVGHGAIIHGCHIGEGSLIGMGAIILNGAKVGKNCLVGAGALVTENMDIPEQSLVFGSPAKVIRNLTSKEMKALEESANEYLNKSKLYKAQLQ